MQPGITAEARASERRARMNANMNVMIVALRGCRQPGRLQIELPKLLEVYKSWDTE